MSFPQPINGSVTAQPEGVQFVDDQQKKATSLLRGWDVTPEANKPASQQTETVTRVRYAPLLETLRLYAGWLLAWYCLVFALGGYQATKGLPFEMPLVYGLAQSPLVLTFALGTFLFLLFSSLAKALDGGKGMGIVFTLLWVVAVYGFRINL